MPLVALVGPITADQWESGVNALLAAAGVGLCWWLARPDRRRAAGATGSGSRCCSAFSTQILWVTTRGGVWHTGHLVATILTFGCLIELWGRQRAWLIGLLAGAAFLTRAPLAFAMPFYALMLTSAPSLRIRIPGQYLERASSVPWRSWIWLAHRGRCRRSWPSSPTTRSGSGRRSSPATRSRRCRRSSRRSGDQGLFSLAHVPMNLDYFLVHLPTPIPDVPVHPPGRPRDVGPADEPGPPLRGPRRLAGAPCVAAAGRHDRRPDPDPAVLRGRMAPVRLPLLP